MTLMLDYARTVVGVRCGSIGKPAEGSPHIGWTTDDAKADALRTVGARTTRYTSRDPRFSGWEISFMQGEETKQASDA